MPNGFPTNTNNYSVSINQTLVNGLDALQKNEQPSTASNTDEKRTTVDQRVSDTNLTLPARSSCDALTAFTKRILYDTTNDLARSLLNFMVYRWVWTPTTENAQMAFDAPLTQNTTNRFFQDNELICEMGEKIATQLNSAQLLHYLKTELPPAAIITILETIGLGRQAIEQAIDSLRKDDACFGIAQEIIKTLSEFKDGGIKPPTNLSWISGKIQNYGGNAGRAINEMGGMITRIGAMLMLNTSALATAADAEPLSGMELTSEQTTSSQERNLTIPCMRNGETIFQYRGVRSSDIAQPASYLQEIDPFQLPTYFMLSGVALRTIGMSIENMLDRPTRMSVRECLHEYIKHNNVPVPTTAVSAEKLIKAALLDHRGKDALKDSDREKVAYLLEHHRIAVIDSLEQIFPESNDQNKQSNPVNEPAEQSNTSTNENHNDQPSCLISCSTSIIEGFKKISGKFFSGAARRSDMPPWSHDLSDRTLTPFHTKSINESSTMQGAVFGSADRVDTLGSIDIPPSHSENLKISQDIVVGSALANWAMNIVHAYLKNEGNTIAKTDTLLIIIRKEVAREINTLISSDQQFNDNAVEHALDRAILNISDHFIAEIERNYDILIDPPQSKSQCCMLDKLSQTIEQVRAYDSHSRGLIQDTVKILIEPLFTGLIKNKPLTDNKSSLGKTASENTNREDKPTEIQKNIGCLLKSMQSDSLRAVCSGSLSATNDFSRRLAKMVVRSGLIDLFAPPLDVQPSEATKIKRRYQGSLTDQQNTTRPVDLTLGTRFTQTSTQLNAGAPFSELPMTSILLYGAALGLGKITKPTFNHAKLSQELETLQQNIKFRQALIQQMNQHILSENKSAPPAPKVMTMDEKANAYHSDLSSSEMFDHKHAHQLGPTSPEKGTLPPLHDRTDSAIHIIESKHSIKLDPLLPRFTPNQYLDTKHLPSK